MELLLKTRPLVRTPNARTVERMQQEESAPPGRPRIGGRPARTATPAVLAVGARAIGKRAGWSGAVFALLLFAGLPLGAGPADLCEDWAAVAAAEHGVPERLLLAITRVETGREADGIRRAWPWAVNAAGEGRWFATRAQAIAFAADRLAEGESQIDVGCFQLNLRWHSRAFASLDQMIEPSRNARYAARFLSALHDEFGDWTQAAAAFHSRTPEHGRAYLARLDEALRGMGASPEGPRALLAGVPARPGAVARTAGGARPASGVPVPARMGSLVPLDAARPPPLVPPAEERR